jgi:uroporphyrinogen decarboxylase
MHCVPWRRKGIRYTDSWGCEWSTAYDGYTGSVVYHPLENWENFETYTAPDPDKHWGWGTIDWGKEHERTLKVQRSGNLVTTGLRHGYMFLTLEYLCGYENLIFDMYEENPKLYALIQMVEDFNFELVKRYLALGPDVCTYPEDLGAQSGPMIMPEHFRKYIIPSYKRLMQPAKDSNTLVRVHSDGYVMDLVDDIIDAGANILNIQDLVNGIDTMWKELKGRVALDLDIDRQNIVMHGSPKDIDDHIHEIVEKLGSKQGGLSLSCGIYPPVPIENIGAIMDALEKYSTFYSK